MLRTRLNDRYIKGMVAFESYGDYAKMSYFGEPNLPLNTIYTFEGQRWLVVKVRRSDYNTQVINVDMVIAPEK